MLQPFDNRIAKTLKSKYSEEFRKLLQEYDSTNLGVDLHRQFAVHAMIKAYHSVIDPDTCYEAFENTRLNPL